MISSIWKATALVLALALSPLALQAQAFPEKPVRLVVPWPPGGSADAIGRIVADALTGALGKTVFVWFGLAAPRGTPEAVLEQINGAMTTALEKPEVAKRLQDMGAEVKTSTAAAFAAFWKDEIERYRGLVELSGATIE